mmetsp:Transcript_8785/g.13559  ORF Transcript_8785/g.13559 Transcript_8785/m.13559 type:complete len:98 (+) Transcript_8785:1316-1609(+)
MLSIVLQLAIVHFSLQVQTVFRQLIDKRYSDMVQFYNNIEDRISFEMYEDEAQNFSVEHFVPLHKFIVAGVTQLNLQLVNSNMMKVSKEEELESVLD